MNVSLPPELEKLVQSKVDSGLFNSASEVIEQALLLLQQRDAELEILRTKMDESLATLDETAEIDDEEFMEHLAGELEAKEAKHKAE